MWKTVSEAKNYVSWAAPWFPVWMLWKQRWSLIWDVLCETEGCRNLFLDVIHQILQVQVVPVVHDGFPHKLSQSVPSLREWWSTGRYHTSTIQFCQVLMASFVPERNWVTPVASTRLLRYSVTPWKAFRDCNSVNYLCWQEISPFLWKTSHKSKQIISGWFKIRIKAFAPAALAKSSSSGWISPRLHLYYEWHPNLHWGLLVFCGTPFQITGHVRQISLQAMNNIICAPTSIFKQLMFKCMWKQTKPTCLCCVKKLWGALPHGNSAAPFRPHLPTASRCSGSEA